jgi:hypothetical protein
MYTFHFADPASQNIRRVLAKTFSQLKETGTWLHVTDFMHNEGGHHTATCRVFLFGDFSNKFQKSEVVCLQRDRVNVSNEFRVRHHTAKPGPTFQRALGFKLCLLPCLDLKTKSVCYIALLSAATWSFEIAGKRQEEQRRLCA